MAKVTGEQVMSMLIRKERYAESIADIDQLIDGGGASVSSVIAPNGEYSEWATLKIIDEILEAYSVYPLAEYVHDYSSGTFEEFISQVDYDDDMPMIPALMDACQKKLLRSMLYCIIRLVADSPWYQGTFNELKSECQVLMKSFAHEVPAEEFWRKDIEQDILSRGAVYQPSHLAAKQGFMLSALFPVLGAKGFLSWGDDSTFFLDDLNKIYEVLSGKSIAESIPKRQYERIASDKSLFRHLKDEVWLRNASDGSMKAAREHQWIDDADIALRRELRAAKAEVKISDDSPELFEGDDEWFEDDDEWNAREVERVERWVKAFPYKDEWCKRYLAMRQAYFKLGGLNPVPEEPEQETISFAERLNYRYLACAIDAVLDARGISHFTDDVFLGVYELLRKVAIRTHRAITQGR